MDININKCFSYHAVYDDSIMDALQFAKENGFSGIQLAVETPHLSFEKLTKQQVNEIREYAEANELSISIHCPDESLSLFQDSVYIREGMYNYFKALFDFAEGIGTKVITIHTGSMTTFPTDAAPEEKVPEVDIEIYKQSFKSNLDYILKLAGERFIICAENYNLDKVTLNLLQEYLDKNKISLCWDLAKTYRKMLEKNMDVEAYFINNIDKIKQVHLHDLNLKGRSHRIIGTGTIDFKAYMTLLAKVQVQDYCIEVRPREKAKESLDNLKKILDYSV